MAFLARISLGMLFLHLLVTQLCASGKPCFKIKIVNYTKHFLGMRCCRDNGAAFLYFEPIVTVIVAGLVLGEPIFLADLLGGVVILLGVWMVNRKQTQT